jgi:hypothetical protein
MLKKNFWLVGLFALAALGVILVLIVTRWGAFVSDDSYYYIKPVRDALAGRGFNPSPIFAPGLPLALFPFGWLGLDPLVGVRWLNALLFGVNIVLGGLLVKRMGASNGFVLLAAVWVALAENALEAHAWAMSEALCITFTLLALYLTVAYLQAPRAWLLVTAALAAAGACLARYAAIPVVAAIGLAVLIFHPRPQWTKRLLDAAVFGALSLLPMGVYILRSAFLLGRPLYYNAYTSQPFTLDNAIWYLYNTLSWFVPGRFLRGHELLAGAGVLIGLVGILVAWGLYRRRKAAAPLQLSVGLWLLLLYVLMNYLLLYFARGFSMLAIYNARYLVPPLLVFLLTVAYLLERFWHSNGRLGRTAVALFCIAFSLYYAYRAADYTGRISQTGLGYLNSGWHVSETIPFLEQHPEIPIVATGDVGIYFWTGRLPKVITGFENLDAMRTYICQNDGLLVIMKQMPTEIYSLDQAAVVGNLELAQELNDSTIYRCPVKP